MEIFAITSLCVLFLCSLTAANVQGTYRLFFFLCLCTYLKVIIKSQIQCSLKTDFFFFNFIFFSQVKDRRAANSVILNLRYPECETLAAQSLR